MLSCVRQQQRSNVHPGAAYRGILQCVVFHDQPVTKAHALACACLGARHPRPQKFVGCVRKWRERRQPPKELCVLAVMSCWMCVGCKSMCVGMWTCLDWLGASNWCQKGRRTGFVVAGCVLGCNVRSHSRNNHFAFFRFCLRKQQEIPVC